MREEPKGFFEVTGFEPFIYQGVFIDKATFGVRASAEKFVAEKGGEIKPRAADAILINKKTKA